MTCRVRPGDTLLQVARRAGIEIPTACFYEPFGGQGNCRMCTVEVHKTGDRTRLVASCTYPVRDEIEVITSTPLIERMRRNLAMLLYREAPNSRYVRDLYGRYDAPPVTPPDPQERCIMCRLCVTACEKMGARAISAVSRGTTKKIGTPYDAASSDCLGCKACFEVCPTGAVTVKEREATQEIWHREFEVPTYPARTSGVIKADPARCTGCKTCEIVCSLTHEGRVAPRLARLRIEQDAFADPTPTIHLCEQCVGPDCLIACPSGAIGIDPKTGARVVDEEKCIACGICVAACQTGMIRLLPDDKAKAFKCDLCGGDPQCVVSCPQRALSYEARDT